MYEYPWSPRSLWQRMNWWQCSDVIVLGLMLAYIVLILIHVSSQYRRACRQEAIAGDSRPFQCRRRQLVADLNVKLGVLNSIAFVAPHLGLAGTCTGLITGFSDIGIEAESALAVVMLVVPVAFSTTVAGLLVTIPAAVIYNYLRARIDLLESKTYSDVPVRRRRPFGAIQKFPLAARLSQTSFPLIGGPILAVLAALVFMEYSSYHIPTGLWVRTTLGTCESDVGDRLIVVHLTDAGKVFLNQDKVDLDSLIDRLPGIYRLRLHRTLYLVADDEVPFQLVADTVNIAKNSMVPGTSTPLDITVQWITPKLMNASCSVVIRSARHAIR
jgi:biopolymer transport protein ExbD